MSESDDVFRVVQATECPACAYPCSARTETALRGAMSEHEAYAHQDRRGLLSWPVSEIEFRRVVKQ